MLQTSNSILALDVGERRIGVATANAVARLAHPFATIVHDEMVFDELRSIIAAESVAVIVVGLPRGLSGQDTAQTAAVRIFGSALEHELGIAVHWQDEAVTSRKAESELNSRGKQFEKGDIDALAATYILEDFIRDNPEVRA